MRTSTVKVATAVALLALAFPLSAEPEWLSKWKTFIDEKVLVKDSDEASEASETTAETEEAAKVEETAKAPPPRVVAPTGNPADFKLSGNWTISGSNGREKLGTIRAGSKFFTLKLSEPKVDLRTAYMQGDHGGFRCTVLDKQVITMEGRFENKNRIEFHMQIKEIGKPAIKHYEMVALRDS